MQQLWRCGQQSMCQAAASSTGRIRTSIVNSIFYGGKKTLVSRRATKLELPDIVTYSIFCIGIPIPVKCDSLGAAIVTACKQMTTGVIVWQIKGSDGFVMERRDIEIECLRRGEGYRQDKP
jgi:hypothetical protein